MAGEVLCTAYFVLIFPHPGLYWIYGNKDDDDDDDDDDDRVVAYDMTN
jgi:hypothetical protein